MSTARSKPILLPPQLDSAAANHLQQLFQQLSTSKNKVTLDGSQVERLTTYYVQLLLSFLHHPERQNLSIIRDASESMRAACRDFGLTNSLSLE